MGFFNKPQRLKRLDRELGSVLLVVVALCSFYLFGAFSYRYELWPMRELRRLVQAAPYVGTNEAVVDKFNRLVGYRSKHEVECPNQTNRTMVLLLIGQSNAANSGGQRYAADHGVLNYFDGKCYLASSPLLGSSGLAGDSWTLLGARLVDQHVADLVVLVPAAIGGTEIARWKQGGDLNAMLRSVLSSVTQRYHITHVIWHQGESDFVDGTSMSDYTTMFMSLVASIREMGVDAPVYVSVATRCDQASNLWTPDNPVARAQKALPNNQEKIAQGVNTDMLLDPIDRNDDCHLGQTGQEKFVNAWLQILSRQ